MLPFFWKRMKEMNLSPTVERCAATFFKLSRKLAVWKEGTFLHSVEKDVAYYAAWKLK